MPNLKPVWIIFKREVRDQVRDWRITMPIFVLTMVFPAIMNFTADRMVTFVENYGAAIIGDRLIPFLLLVVGFFPVSVSLIIALESFVGEKERGSIEPLLSSPFEDWQLYLGKLLAVMVPPLTAAYFGFVVYLVGVYRNIGWTAEPELLLQIVALSTIQALVMVSGAVVISTQTTSVRAANLLASFIIIPVAFLIQGESMVMFWGQYRALWWVVLGMAIIALLLVRTGVAYFNREELLGKELDVLNIKWMMKVIVSAFKGEASSVWNWWRLSVWPSFKELLLPIGLVFIMFVASLWVGASQADVFPIPEGLINFDSIDGNMIEGFENYSLFSGEGIGIIWRHNIRAMIIAFVFGIFSYSVLGIMVVLLPFFIIGYVMGLFAVAGFPAYLFFTAFVLPHGIIEIPAILISGAAIYRLGARLAGQSGEKSIVEGLLQSFGDWVKIMVGIVMPLLLISAVIEALVTPKIAIWVITTFLG